MKLYQEVPEWVEKLKQESAEIKFLQKILDEKKATHIKKAQIVGHVASTGEMNEELARQIREMFVVDAV